LRSRPCSANDSSCWAYSGNHRDKILIAFLTAGKYVLLVASAFTYLSDVAGSIFLIAVLLPLLAERSRRLNDIGKSGWWLFYLLIPIGGLVQLGILWAQPPAETMSDDALIA